MSTVPDPGDPLANVEGTGEVAADVSSDMKTNRVVALLIAVVAAVGLAAQTASAAPPVSPPEGEAWPADAFVISYRFHDLFIGGESGGSYSVTVGRVGDGTPSVEVTTLSDDQEPIVITESLDVEVFDEVVHRLIATGVDEDEAAAQPMCTDSPYHELTVSFGGSTIVDVETYQCGSDVNPVAAEWRSILAPAYDVVAPATDE